MKENSTENISPPSSITTEAALLGAIIHNNEVLCSVEEFLKPEHFIDPLHSRIYAVMQKMSGKSLPISIASLEGTMFEEELFVQRGKTKVLKTLVVHGMTLINPYQHARLIYDLAIKRSLIQIGSELIHDSYSSNLTESPEAQISKVEDKLFKLSEQGTLGKNFSSLSSLLDASMIAIDHAMTDPKHITGISSGFLEMDKKLAGFQDSDLVIIAARPSMGKTALAINIALNAAKTMKKNNQYNNVGFFSLEMSEEQLATRILSVKSAISPSLLRTGKIKEEQYNLLRRKAEEITANTRLFIDDTPALSIAALRSRARRLKRQHGLDILFVDYLQLIHLDKNVENRALEISTITQGLKALAKELNIPVIALSQLSRAVEHRQDKKPILSDLRESGTIEQDADIVIFIYREEYYLSRSTPSENASDNEFEMWQAKLEYAKNKAEIMLAKHRNGPIGNFLLHYDTSTTAFSNLQTLPTRNT
ncbi:replicative DNA helicase [Candidatus Sneabacter namystus]|uniref:Replicative DNA helicase n=1 Tax=Candidatus Sneabacter namystus TaxID=2601646 RepID=A0A5C0UHC2_9RICK|nr:replicative DNA helicase [Candidatus Sneabacter namystus]QEK39466.1 replicative DNA helicase [Candidatus Sneabacter namystus]